MVGELVDTETGEIVSRSNNLPVIPKAGSAISALDVARIEQQIAETLHEVTELDVLDEARARAAALESYLRDKELQRPMLGVQRRIEARIGQLLGDTSQGERNDLTLLHEVKLRGNDRHDFRILARGIDWLSDEEWRKSRRALVSYIRQKTGDLPKTPPLPAGLFRVIVADPPWQLDTGPSVFNGTGESGHDNLPYEQMSIERIKALPVRERAAADAHLYLWTTNRYVEAAYEVARAWGFKPSVLLVWAKTPRGVGLGDAYRLTTEFVLYARRGSLKELAITETTWFNWPRGKHSEKPEAFYSLVESMSPGEKLEMFARKARDGWTAWGDEAPA